MQGQNHLKLKFHVYKVSIQFQLFTRTVTFLEHYSPISVCSYEIKIQFYMHFCHHPFFMCMKPELLSDDNNNNNNNNNNNMHFYS